MLLIDLDPQGNATTGSGIDKRQLARSVYQVLLGSATVRAAIARAEAGGYDLLPANREVAGAEVDLVDLDDRELRLKQALAPIEADGIPWDASSRSPTRKAAWARPRPR